MTRRCTQRQFLLRPSSRTNQIIEYCLAITAKQTGIQIHAVCFMSNHWHGVVSDPLARLPEFLERFHRLVARAQNASLGRWENLWSSDKPSVVLLVSDHDVLEKMAYTIANPTAAGLVRSPDAWPGVVSRRIIEQRRIARPGVFFNPNGTLPDSALLEITRPPIYGHLPLPALARQLNEAVQRLTRATRKEFANQRKRFLGTQAILQQPFDGTPISYGRRRSLKPQVAAKHSSERIDAIRRLKAFLQNYRAAWQAWRQGNRSQLFPSGTYALRLHARVTCRPP